MLRLHCLSLFLFYLIPFVRNISAQERELKTSWFPHLAGLEVGAERKFDVIVSAYFQPNSWVIEIHNLGPDHL